MEKVKNLFGGCWRNVCVAFCSALIVGLITYATIIILQPVCADPILTLDYWKSGEWQLFSQGRWSSNLFFFFRGYLVIPALSCIFLILDCSVCAALFVHIFNVRRTSLAGLIGVLFVVHPHIANVQMYYLSSSVFIYSIIMFTLWFTYCTNISIKWKIAINSCLIILCIAFSQSILSLFTCITVLKFILDLIKGREKNTAWKNFLLNVFSAAIGCVSYLIIWKGLCIITNTSTFYGGAEEYGISNSFIKLSESIVKIYKIFISFYFDDTILFNTYWYRQIINLILLLCGIGMIFIIVYQNFHANKINLREILFALLLLLLMPIALAPFVLVVTDYTFYLMTASGFLPIIPFIVVLLDQTEIAIPRLTKLRVLSLIAVVAIAWTYILTNNAGFLLLNKTFTQTKALAERILIRIEDLENFSYDMPICIIGQPADQVYAIDVNLYNASPGSTFSQLGVWDGIWENSDGWGLYIYHYCGVKLNYLTNGSQQRIAELSETDEFKSSECFPAKDSVQIIDGTVVVKLGEVDYSEYAQ